MGMEIQSYKVEEDIHITEEEEDISDLELVLFFRDELRKVSNAGFEHYTDSYSQMIDVFVNHERLNPDEVALLVTSLKALSRVVSYIDIDYHNSLLTSIFRMSMWNYGTDVMDALVDLIKSLAASNGEFICPCLEMLVSNFLPPPSFLCLLSQPCGIAKKEQVLDRVHSALKDIADLVPLAPKLLSEKIISKYRPLMTSKNGSSTSMIKVFLQMNEIYMENMLKLESGLLRKYLGKQMISEVVYRLVELDVEIEWDEIVQDDPSKDIFDMDLEDIAEDAEDDRSSNLPQAGFGLQKLGIDVYAEKLDSLMVIMCDHIKSCSDDGRLAEVFETLLLSFQKSILNAHKSKFAQFVIFYACSLDPEGCGTKFSGMLADIFVHGESSLTRMSAVAYLASYLSRARFIRSSVVASTLQRLVDWCSDYCTFKELDEKRINPFLHSVFYSGCQAVMYVLCFRMRRLMDVPHIKSQLLHMPLKPILRNSLDPLQVCLPSIVMEFLRQAKAHQLFAVSEDYYFDNLIESDLSKAYGGIERLDTFFPFDPCLLKNCNRYIQPCFQSWSMANQNDDNESSDEEVNMDEGFVDGNSECFFDDAIERNFDDLDLGFEFENSKNKQMPRQMPARIRPSMSPESP